MNLIEHLKKTREHLGDFGSDDPLMRVLGAFQEGDAEKLCFVLSGEWNVINCGCDKCQDAANVIRRLAGAATLMETMEADHV
jgi:hypothetical protein